MALFTIRRNIFRALDLDLAKEYVAQQIMNEYQDVEHLDKLASYLTEAIHKNEMWHERYGKKQANGLTQVEESCTIPAYSEWSGYLQVANLVVAPFDWSWEENGDFDYTFFIAQSIAGNSNLN